MKTDFDLGPHWTDQNRETLTAVLHRYGKGGAQYDSTSPPIAAFDWDDTVAENDMGDAFIFYQFDHLGFDFDAPGFWELIPQPFRRVWEPSVRVLRRLLDERPGGWARDKIGQRLPEGITAHPAYSLYRYHSYRLFHDMLDAPVEIGYPWFARVLVGLTMNQVLAMAESALDRALSQPMGYEVILDPAGGRPVRIRSGVRYRPQMLALIHALRECGFEVWIVTASVRYPIQVMAGRLGIPAKHVVGMTTTLQDGQMTTEVVVPAPFYGGKAAALQHVLPRGRRVVLAAGDSPRDEDLLRLAEAARLVVTPSADLLATAQTGQARGEPWLIQMSFGEPPLER